MPTTIRTTLSDAITVLQATSPSARLDAELLLGHVTGWSRAQLLAHASDIVTPDVLAHYHTLIERRSRGESVAYLTNQREFYGHDMYVDARVLVPRPETELLVECAIAAAHILRPAVIVDVGSGSGCIGVALARAGAAPTIIGIDVSADALAVSAINRDRHGLNACMHLLQADLCTACAPVSFMVSNPPYVMADDGNPDVRLHEPHIALFGGDPDGAAVYRRFALLLPQHLRSPGYFACEIDPRQAAIVCGLLQTAFPAGRVVLHHDLAGHARVVELWLESERELSEWSDR